MDHDTYVRTVREESERFLAVLADADLTAPVPACPGWTVTDLLRHLGTGQHEWAQIARGAREDDVTTPEPPADDDLVTFVAAAGTELLAALADRPPGTPAWSWHPGGGTLAWLARRQAHEALVHRVDAEQAAGQSVRPPVPELAADGVDELLRSFVDGVPEWGTFTPDGVRVRIEATNQPGATWVLDLGRFEGTSPGGTHHELDAALLVDDDSGPAEALLLRGPAWELDLWLWGRGDGAALETRGDPAVRHRLRALVDDATSG